MARTVSVKGLQDMQRENGQAAPEPNQDDEAVPETIEVANGAAKVGDTVVAKGLSGTIAGFAPSGRWRPARGVRGSSTQRPGGWDVDVSVWHEDISERRAYEPGEVSLRLGEPAAQDSPESDSFDSPPDRGTVSENGASVSDSNAGGPREYDVDSAGSVRDWRRPDTTPDRGAVTEVHTLTDDETVYQAAYADAAEQIAQQASLFLVPTDAAFNGRLYRDAPELANLAEKLIGEHGHLSELRNCVVRWYWKRKTGVSKGRVKIGFMKRASDLLGHFSGADFIGWLSATTARDGKFTDQQIEAAVFHQLLHIGSDDNGNWIFAPHDFEGFAQEVRVFGTWTSDLKLGGGAFVAAHQMGLFTEDEDDAEDDGSGVLIHADGSPMTDGEIEAMERHELDDDDDDILADPAVI